MAGRTTSTEYVFIFDYIQSEKRRKIEHRGQEGTAGKVEHDLREVQRGW